MFDRHGVNAWIPRKPLAFGELEWFAGTDGLEVSSVMHLGEMHESLRAVRGRIGEPHLGVTLEGGGDESRFTGWLSFVD
jgi:hypothetical protein